MEEFLTNEYKTRNILSLADRMQVIREYDSFPTRPSFQSLATKFDCSSKQIKNILQNREAILTAYHEAGDGLYKETRDDVMRKRQEKIEFLGKVMYEYLQRMVYNNYGIDEEKVHQKALQIKECIAIENFQPNNGWFQHFKRAYGIPGFDMESLRNNIQIMEAKRPHISAIDMIQYVSRQEQKLENEDSKESRKKKRGRPTRLERIQRGEGLNVSYEPIDGQEDYYDDDNNVSYDVQKRKTSSCDFQNHSQPFRSQDGIALRTYKSKLVESPSKIKISNAHSLSSQKRKRSISPFPDIDSTDEALRHIKVLEEYAMLQDNYRAIGLLTQLEQIFKKKTKDAE